MLCTSAEICWSRHQNLKQFTSYDEGTQEVSRLLSCTTTACLLLVNNLFWVYQWPIRQPSSSSTTQQSRNLLRYLIIASELFQVLMSASTDPGACVWSFYFLPLKTPLPSLKTQNWTKSQFFLGHPVVIGSEKQSSYSMTKSLWDIFSNWLQ